MSTNKEFNTLLLKTAFSCMACDGDIDNREVALIKQMHESQAIFGDIDLASQMKEYLKAINENSGKFLRSYFSDLSMNELTDEEQINLVRVAIETIKADKEIKYSEVKFFKVIKSRLTISNDKILEVHPDFEDYLEDAIISDSYLNNLLNDFIDTVELPQFDKLDLIN
jgi:uncharacterized tellurite resistance protein B-like protein